MGPTLRGSFKELIIVMGIAWGPNKGIDIEKWSICVGGQLERFYCILVRCSCGVVVC